MLALLKAEFMHYRKWAIGLFVLQAMAWVISLKLNGYTNASAFDNEVTLILSLFGGFIFGVLQMVSNTRKNHWTYLLQRPLEARDIYLSLSAASILHIFIAFPLLWLGVVAGFDVLTNAAVDMRHYYMAPYLMFYTISTYLIGHLVILNPSRGAIFAGFGLLTLHNDLPQFTWLKFLGLLLVIVILLYLNIKSFNADRSKQIKSITGTATLAIPMQVTLVFFLSISTSLFYDIPQTLMKTHPEQKPADGTFEKWRSVDDKNRIANLLENNNKEGSQLLARQSQLADHETITTVHRAFNQKSQLNFRDRQWFLNDEESQTLWVFSHDEMLLQGTDNLTGDVIGWLGLQGFITKLNTAVEADRFNTVPSMLNAQFIVTEKTIYQVDFSNKRLLTKLMMTSDEHLVGRPEFKQHFVALVTNKNTYFFEPTAFSRSFEPAVASFKVPHPTDLHKVEGIETARMTDGYLLTYFGQHYVGFDVPGAQIIHTRENGNVEQVHNVQFNTHSYPQVIRHFDFIISPVIYTLREKISHFMSPASTQKREGALSNTWSNTILIMICALQIASALIILWLGRRIRLMQRHLVLWFIMGLTIGTPALLSFLLINKVRQKVPTSSVPNLDLEPITEFNTPASK